MSEQPNPTALASWMRGLAQQLRHEGHEPEPLFAEAGLDYQQVDEPDARFPVVNTTRLWQRAVELTGDEALGLKAIRFITPTNFHFVGMSVLASRNLEEAFQRLSTFGDLVTDANRMVLNHTPEGHFEVRIELKAGALPAHQSTDGLMALLANAGKGLGAPELKPLWVELTRPQPQPDNLDYFDRTFATELRYGCPQMKLVYTTDTVKTPLSGANPAIAAHMDQASLVAIERLKPPSSCTQKVKQLVSSHLSQQTGEGLPNAETLARQLNMSSRNLQRKLAEEGTTLVDIVDQAKKAAAQQRLEGSQDPITAIALDLGFSDSSAFSRACKRWFGKSPSQIRSPKA